ncbi:hypothetical protein A6R68_08124 [Neotoma lepida]|uniref:Uncharacterized protein n=1 Tax=Neotoma lepida TaxID=56216 RepID=A0A1A6G4I4_NEOLE|nr:hypothetical protein A6R68_08124 [Neotoma lepida]
MTEVQLELKRGLQEQEWHPFLFHGLCFEAKVKHSNDFRMRKKMNTVNPDIMSEVINRPLQILTINVSEGDHQAQVDPGKAAATYQLTERKYSYRIKMNHFKTPLFCLRD